MQTINEDGSSFVTDRYTVRGELGEGAFGKVWRAWDDTLKQEVALKSLHQLQPSNLLVLKHEFRSMSDITHPNLVRYFDLVSDDETSFITMELVEGVELLDYCWAGATTFPGQAPDVVARIESTFHQLAAAIDALHGYGQLHRDIKPGNVLVSPNGHVTLLDFGLVRDAYGDDTRTVGVGTPGFWAPEQLTGHPVPESDWYSFAVTLFRAFTGQRVPPVIMVDPDEDDWRFLELVPAHWRGCLRALLDRDPAARGGINRLPAPDSGDEHDVDRPRSSARLLTFIGREAEIDTLAALQRDNRDRSFLSFVSGESGIGKTETVRQALDVAFMQDTLVLHSKCRYNEHVRYRTIDPLIDELARFLEGLPPTESLRLLPRKSLLAPLMQQFPVFRIVPGFQADALTDEETRSLEIRDLALRGLGEVLLRITDERPLVIWIDDAQWGDADSLVVLREVLDTAPCHLLLTVRSQEDPGEFVSGVRGLGETLALPSHDLELEPLAADSARALVNALIAEKDTSTRLVDRLLAEADGSPFLINEIARSIDSPETLEQASFSLGSALRSRFEQLPEASRSLVNSVAVSSHPLPLEAALAIAFDAPAAIVRDLTSLCWLRTREENGELWLDSYHDRVRETVAALLPPADAAAVHRRCATALEKRGDVAPAWMVEHLLGCGEDTSAAPWAFQAAESAMNRFAYHEASEHLGLGIQLVGDNAEYAHFVAHAEALRLASRSGEAAMTLEQAAALPEAADHWVDLRLDTASHYVKSAQIRKALSTMEGILPELGVRVQRDANTTSTTRRLRNRAILRTYVFGFRRGTRRGDQPSKINVEALTALGEFLDPVDVVHGDLIGVQALNAALIQAPLPALRRVLLHEATKLAQFHGFYRRISRRVLLAGIRAARELNVTGYDLAHTYWCIATVYWCRSEWAAARRWWARSEKILRSLKGGVAWELTYLDMFLSNLLLYGGELAELRSRADNGIRLARERNDTWSWTIYETAIAPIASLADDRPADVYARTGEAVGKLADQGMLAQHLFQVINTTRAMLYQDMITEGWTFLDGYEQLMNNGGVDGRMADWRIERIKLALAFAHHCQAAGDPDGRITGLLEIVNDEADKVGADPLPANLAWRSVSRAAASVFTDPVSAPTRLAEAAQAFDAADMPLLAIVTNRRRAELTDSEDDMRTADDWLAARGIANPRAFSNAFCPVVSPPASTV